MALRRFCTVYCTTFQAPTVSLVENGVGRYDSIRRPHSTMSSERIKNIHHTVAGLRSSACSWKTAPRVVTVVRYAGLLNASTGCDTPFPAGVQ